MKLFIAIIIISVSGVLAGCGGAAQEPQAEPEPGAALEAASGFGQEAWGIGPSWYDYDSMTHAVTPRPELYIVGDVSFEVTNYYDETGTSGYFTLRSEGDELTLETNVKEEPACVGLSPLEQVSCDEQADLVFSTLRRPFPEAGFAVANPGFWSIPRPDLQTWRTSNKNRESSKPASNMDERDDDRSANDDRESSGWTEVRSVAVDPSVSRVHGHDGVHLQVDPEFGLTAWTVTKSETGWRFDVLCGDADYEVDTPLSDAMTTAVELESGRSQVVIDLCNGRIEDAESWLGLWPKGSYDLVATTVDDRLILKLHPAALHWNWGESEGFDSIESAREALVWEGLE